MGDYDSTGRDLQSSRLGKYLIQRQTAMKGMVMTKQLSSAANFWAKMAAWRPNQYSRTVRGSLHRRTTVHSRGRIDYADWNRQDHQTPARTSGPYNFCQNGLQHSLVRDRSATICFSLAFIFLSCRNRFLTYLHISWPVINVASDIPALR